MSLETVLAQSQKHLSAFMEQMDAGLIDWKPLPVPEGKEHAMRAFEGASAKYRMLVTQANVRNMGVIHRAIMTSSEGLVIVVHEQMANFIYHKVAAKFN